jgi:hypothetical protein
VELRFRWAHRLQVQVYVPCRSSGAASDHRAKISIFGGFLLSVRRAPHVSAILRRPISVLVVRRGPHASAILRQPIAVPVFSLPPYCGDAFLRGAIWRV